MKELQCTAINHPWQIKPPIYVLKNGDLRVRLECARCGGFRYDTRSPKGGVLNGRTYDHSKAYDEVLKETKGSKNRRADAWVSLVGDIKEVKVDEANRSRLRLVHDTAKGVRRRKPKPVKRPRDKKRRTA